MDADHRRLVEARTQAPGPRPRPGTAVRADSGSDARAATGPRARPRARAAAGPRGRSGTDAGSRAPPAASRLRPAVAGFLTSSYGPRWGTHHNGIDIGANLGTPILSAADGVIIDAGPASGFGLWVRVQHTDGTITVYGHVDTFVVNVGQPVLAGELIATVGNRGQSTGPHLHLEVWNPAGYQVDPLIWLHDSGVAVNW
ncbi:peptidoglycan DD-metalloendopeptidase family protein [Rhodococcus hoagii]|nr:peptidoglycan DD-metalloendopeptidase family protein [Prescottella equi]